MGARDITLLLIVVGVAAVTLVAGIAMSSSLTEKPRIFDNSLPWMRANLTAILADTEKYGVLVNQGDKDIVMILSYIDNYTISVTSGYKSAGRFHANRSELISVVQKIWTLAKQHGVTLILLPRSTNESIGIVASLYCGNITAYIRSIATNDRECVEKAATANETAWRISRALAYAYAYEPMGVRQPVNPPTIWLLAINVTGIRTGDPYLSYAPFTYPNPIRDKNLSDWLRFVTNLFASLKCIWTKDPWCWGTTPPES